MRLGLATFLFLWSMSVYAQQVPQVNVYIHGCTETVYGLPQETYCCDVGLHHISQLSESHMFVKDAQLMHQQSPEKFDLDHYYTLV